MTLYLSAALLSAKCHSCRWMQTHSQRLALPPSPSVSRADALNTRVDTILRLTEEEEKKTRGKDGQIPRTSVGKCERQIM